jgi:hypothetical protein
MSIYQPFTYLIGWSKLDRWYYGVRYARGCSPNDLWRTYFTSSDHVQSFREYNGEPDVIEVRRFFDNRDKAIYHEHRVLHLLGVIRADRWLNRSAGGLSNPGRPAGWNHTEEAKEKMRQAALGREVSQEARDKMSKARKGQTLSEEHCRKIAEAKRGKPRPEDMKKRLSDLWKGKPLSEERKMLLRQTKTCEHCGNTSILSVYGRYHGDKCDDKNQ